jgi:hypothetical protein
MRALRLLPFLLPLVALPFACARSGNGNTFSPGEGGKGGDGVSSGQGGTGGSVAGTGGSGGLFETDGGLITDASTDVVISPDAACAAAVETATVEKLPVDIIWMVDNSSSMAPAVAEVKKGLNAFAAAIGAKNLDYKVIMLSLRSKDSPIQFNGSTRYPVCIPPPLAGDSNCGNGPRFFQSSIDIKSTQPLEQFLGTLGQTSGYAQGEAKGGEPWKQELRPNATKTIVIVTDDNSRLSADQFEHFAGGKDPFNTTVLPPGILDPSWNKLFDGYVFSGLYGWSSDATPNDPCTYADGTQPPSSGPVYTTLVKKTGGVRAHVCDGSNAWGPFFDAVAQAVDSTAKLSCDITIPKPPSGDIDPTLVNVALVSGGMSTYLPNVGTVASCDASGGWYYDNPAMPKKVILCQSSCDAAQAMIGPNKPGSIEVLFGCQTIPK